MFKNNQYTVEEGDMAMVKVCAIVQHPEVLCGINFPFIVIPPVIIVQVLTQIHGMLM